MKAIVYSGYGSADVLQSVEIPKPVPGDGEVLIKVRAASLNPLDWRFMHGKPYLIRLMTGLRKPGLGPAVDVSGEVEAVGKNVTQLKPGDAVFGSCSHGLAEYASAPEASVVTKPGNMTFEQAAAVSVAGRTALQGLRDRAHVEPGQRVLINGAAGGVGTFAVQIARSFGANVTGVCSTRNVEMVRSIGADRVIDYTKEDFTRGGERYNLIFDCIGNHSLRAFRRALTPQGIWLGVGGSFRYSIQLLAGPLSAKLMSQFGTQKFLIHLAKRNRDDLVALRDLMEAGTLVPVLDRGYRMDETRDAMRYLETGHARGKVVVTFSDS